MIGRSAIGRSTAVLAATLAFIAAPKFGQSPDHPITRSSDALRLAGELDAKGFEARVAAEKGRVVLVNFWATWCAPCREEFPDLVRLHRAYSGKGLSILGVSTDFASQLPAVERFLAENRPPFPNYRKLSDGDDQDFIDAVDTSWGGELPFSVLYDRQGKKVRVLSGKQAYADFEREVLRLLPQGDRHRIGTP